MSQMEFGKLVGKLLNYTGAKNYALASELGYDVSYISKMVNSRIYPASKNADSICQKIAAFVTEEMTDSARHVIESFLEIEIDLELDGAEKEELFRKAVAERLFTSYLYSMDKKSGETENAAMNEYQEEANSYTLLNPRLRRKFLRIAVEESATEEDPLEMIVMANLFELSRDDKLYLAGIKRGETEQIRPELMRLKMILSISDGGAMDVIFDPILFIYMISNFSSASFSIYATNFPFHAVMMSAKKHFAHFGIPGKDGKLIMATTSSDERVIQDTYETLDELIATNCHPIFDEYTVEEMIVSKQYMRSIIGKNIRVLIGTVSELFLPSDLFRKIAEKQFGNRAEVYEELKNIDVVLNNATYNSEMQVLLYEQTLNNYVLTGEISYFNKKIKLSIAERKAHIKNMIHLLETHPNIQMKIIKRYFVEEFKWYDNPSCYLSSFLNYLRITSRYTDKTLLIIKEKRMNEVFDRFFTEAWENCGDMVSGNAIIPTIELSLNYMELLEIDNTV